MNYKVIRLLKVGIILFLTFCLFGAINFLEKNYTIRFSAESGFYDAPFYLEIRGGVEKIVQSIILLTHRIQLLIHRFIRNR